MNLVAHTTVFCGACRTSHPARILREGDRIVGVAECPADPPPVELSDDADLFLLLRERDLAAGACSSGSPRFSRAQLYITNDCDRRCPVCYASSSPDGGASHLTVPEALRRVAAGRRHGLRRLLLIGGEPTVHPELLAIIRAVHHLGVSVSLVTNGRAVGERPELAGELKRAGLVHLNLQFDTLDRKTLRVLRGHDDLEGKFRAIRFATEARLPFSLTVTVARPNLSEVGGLIRWARNLPVMPSLILFQSMVPHGRFPADLATVSREAMLNAAIESGVIVGATRDQVHAVPPFPPDGLAVHPDCGSLIFALRREGRLMPADTMMDIADFGRAVADDRGFRRHWVGWVGLFLRHLRPGHRREFLGALFDLRPGRPNRRLMMVGFTSFCSPAFLDEQRLARCGNYVLTGDGPEPICGSFARRSSLSLPLVRTSP